MPDLTVMKRPLHLQQTEIASLLLHLNSLTGLVFLQDQQHPVIGFLPQAYLQVQNGQSHFMQRDEQLGYQVQEQTIDFTDFIAFVPTLEHADAGFQGGMIGFVSYDFAAQQQIQNQSKEQPALYFGRYHSYLKLEQGQWYFYSDEVQAEQLWQLINHLLIQPLRTEADFQLTQPCQARWSRQDYQRAFTQVQDYIRAGDCYQINLTQEFTGIAHGELLATAEQFWQLTNAPYAGYLKLDGFELLSCSPELFIDFQAKRRMSTRPIKGTMPRHADPQQDEQSRQQLAASQKDQAENVMIVDLLRNDLSVYAENGSVKTPILFEIESFNQVHHMVSEVTAILKPEVNPIEMLLSALPGGSITGAPKIRAMQIIEELEGAPRGAYCGSMGYFNFNGTGRWNILIRSIQKYQHQISLWAGGGITIASDSDAEYQECFDKVSAMLNLLNTWQKS